MAVKLVCEHSIAAAASAVYGRQSLESAQRRRAVAAARGSILRYLRHRQSRHETQHGRMYFIPYAREWGVFASAGDVWYAAARATWMHGIVV